LESVFSDHFFILIKGGVVNRLYTAFLVIFLGFVTALILPLSANATFAVAIDTNLKGDPETIPGPGQQVDKVVGVIMDPFGRTDQFVEGEVILKPKDVAERDQFIQKWQGVILSDGTIPVPPQQFLHLERTIPESSGYLRISVNSSLVDTQQIITNGTALGFDGMYTCSSLEMLQMFALVLEERVNNIQGLDLNGVFTLRDCFKTNTQEYAVDPSAPNPALVNDGYMDAFSITNYNDPDISVTQAWQLTELFGVSPGRVPLCVIDTGFIINDDFPAFLPYDFVDDDRIVDADEGGYHGTRTLSVASARLDDQFGSAGTGGPVALPMPFRFDLTFSQGARAIRTATRWGAEVINNSWGGTCDWWCDTFGGSSGEDAINEALDEAFDNGVVTVAAAGNSEDDLDDIYDLPSEGGAADKGNIVVGALDLATKDSIQTATHGWGSSFGSALDTWIAVWPRILSTPTPSDTTISTIGRTSGASAYTAGVVALMKALSPTLTASEVHEMVDLSNMPSTDPRVASGYLNVFDAVHRAASHVGAVDPPADTQEPNDHSDFMNIDPGTYCANLYDGDTEDGYWFWVDDIRPVQVQESRQLFGNYTATLNGFHLDSEVALPFNGELIPGSYYLRFTKTTAGAAFYELDLAIGAPSAMSPDRYEVNDTLATAAELTLPGNRIGRVWTIDTLNFHVSGDPDYFDIALPSLPSLLYTDRITIWVEPTEDGYSSSFNLFVYDESGVSVPVTGGSATTIENVRGTFTTGRIRFLVEDRMVRRNHYRILIGYDQYVRGVAEPETFAFPDIPSWMPDPSDLFFLHIPELALDGVVIDFPFPGDPVIAKDIAEGNPPAEIPTEMMVLNWMQKNNFVMEITYTGYSQDMGFTLIDHKGDILVEAYDVPIPKNKSLNDTSEIRKRLEFQGMERGIYGIQVDGTEYPTLYAVKIEAVNMDPRKSMLLFVPAMINGADKTNRKSAVK